MESDRSVHILRRNLAGNILVNHYSADSYEQTSKDFTLYYETQYREKPDALAALGSGIVALVSSFFKDHPGIHKDQVLAALSKYEFTGLLGKIKFNGDGDAFKSAAILRHSAEGNDYITTIKPEVLRVEEFQKNRKGYRTPRLRNANLSPYSPSRVSIPMNHKRIL